MNERETKWDKRFLQLAKFISSWSKDPSTKVGAVITDDNKIVSVGYNGFPKNIADDIRLQDREVKYQFIVHGEINAIHHANRSLKGCTLYTYPFMPCARCGSQIIQTGIERIVSIENNNERWRDSFNVSQILFKEAGIKLHLYSSNEVGIEI